MHKSLLFCLSILVSMATFSQENIEKELDSIQTESQATAFLKNNKSKKGKLITFNKEQHNTRLANELFRLNEGGRKVYKTEIDKTYYKVIGKVETPYYRVSYIFLDRARVSLKTINTLRKDIISKYRKGTEFEDLARRYSMDINAKKGGDLGWFTRGEMHPDFEDPIINGDFDVNDIFTIDIPSNNWYYVVLKTESTKLIEEIKVLKITEPIK